MELIERSRERARREGTVPLEKLEPLHCTHELLEKLIDDLIASAP